MGEAFDEPQLTTGPTVGEQLRAAREAKGLTLEDIAAQTRIPRRHLESLENSDWDNLPAPTYTTGFAKSYASAVGLDRVDIADQLREAVGGYRPISTATLVFEPTDPARTMPKWLVFGAIAAVLLLALVLSWLNEQSWQEPDSGLNDTTAAAPSQAGAQMPVPGPAIGAPAAGPVVITANEPVWIQVYERGGSRLFEGVLAAGQRYDVPVTATAPLLKTAKAEALRISVGTADAPTVGPPATTIRDISLLGPDLMRGPQPANASPVTAASAATRSAPPARTPRTRPRTAPTQAAPAAPEAAPPQAPVVENTAG